MNLSDEARVEMLERQVRELSLRVAALEGKVNAMEITHRPL